MVSISDEYKYKRLLSEPDPISPQRAYRLEIISARYERPGQLTRPFHSGRL